MAPTSALQFRVDSVTHFSKLFRPFQQPPFSARWIEDDHRYLHFFGGSAGAGQPRRHRQQATSLLRSSSPNSLISRPLARLARALLSIRPNVQTSMAVRQVGIFDRSGRSSPDASKIANCARFSGIRSFGRVEGEEIAAKGSFDRGSKRPTPPRNRSGGSPSRPAARADAR